jgi:hypothetical protein
MRGHRVAIVAVDTGFEVSCCRSFLWITETIEIYGAQFMFDHRRITLSAFSCGALRIDRCKLCQKVFGYAA